MPKTTFKLHDAQVTHPVVFSSTKEMAMSSDSMAERNKFLMTLCNTAIRLVGSLYKPPQDHLYY